VRIAHGASITTGASNMCMTTLVLLAIVITSVVLMFIGLILIIGVVWWNLGRILMYDHELDD
jgi:hypothetical protein